MEIENSRSCGSCTACCEGWLFGKAYDYSFWRGRKCHYLGSSGCSIYGQHPDVPCKSFKCVWLTNLNIPEWMKPNESGIILTYSTYLDFEYLLVTETNIPLKAEVLSWLFMEYINGNIGNFCYQLNSGLNYVGSTEFLNAVNGKIIEEIGDDLME